MRSVVLEDALVKLVLAFAALFTLERLEDLAAKRAETFCRKQTASATGNSQEHPLERDRSRYALVFSVACPPIWWAIATNLAASTGVPILPRSSRIRSKKRRIRVHLV